MNTPSLGYSRDLFVLPFDHRGSFEAGLLGVRDRVATATETERLAAYKRIIYDGFLRAIAEKVPQGDAAILVDQQYGEAILTDGGERGLITCAPVEKSSREEFEFEYGADFEEHLRAAAPTFAKVLVRYNPEGDAQANQRQRTDLKRLSDYTHSAGYKFMFELLVPATVAQLEAVGGDARDYDLRTRPGFMVQAMAELQKGGVEPDVWKLEGVEGTQAAGELVAQARSGDRQDVGIIVLGRGEDAERVNGWITVAAQTRGFIGFAVGRTVFWGPLIDHKEGRISRDEAVARISATYQGLHALFTEVRGQQRSADPAR
jgi:5-dehydro-2-deoxygluconokinase